MYWPPDGVFSIFLYLKLNTKTERQILIKADRPIRFFYLYKCEQTKQKMEIYSIIFKIVETLSISVQLRHWKSRKDFSCNVGLLHIL